MVCEDVVYNDAALAETRPGNVAIFSSTTQPLYYNGRIP